MVAITNQNSNILEATGGHFRNQRAVNSSGARERSSKGRAGKCPLNLDDVVAARARLWWI